MHVLRNLWFFLNKWPSFLQLFRFLSFKIRYINWEKNSRCLLYLSFLWGFPRGLLRKKNKDLGPFFNLGHRKLSSIKPHEPIPLELGRPAAQTESHRAQTNMWAGRAPTAGSEGRVHFFTSSNFCLSPTVLGSGRPFLHFQSVSITPVSASFITFSPSISYTNP